jgi:hypothetical protein
LANWKLLPARLDSGQRRKGRSTDQPGRRTGHYPGHAAADGRADAGSRAGAAGQRPGPAGTQHARSAGIGDVHPHAADFLCLLPFPARGARSLAGKLGKQVELKTIGETTELDKGLIERIADPLTHLIRNSLDHGIETPEKRIAAGKSRLARSR